MQNEERFEMVAKTLYGLEDLLAKELEALGAEQITIGRRMVSFWGDKRLMYKTNLWLRTALRVLKPILSFKAKNPEELYDGLRAFDWQQVMNADHSFAIDTVVYSDLFNNSQYLSHKAKDAIVDYFVDLGMERPSVRLSRPDIRLNLHISHQDVTLSLDSSGESLHKRGYRKADGMAPLNEVLAAAIILKTGWQGECELLDPMCGSATLLIEAALIARNIAPGIYRKSYAFEKWIDFDSELLSELYNDESETRTLHCTIRGGDISPQAVEAAKENIASAGLQREISIERIAFQQQPPTEEPLLIVCNPPYGERIKLEEMESFYSMIGERLKHNYGGSKAWILGYKQEHFYKIGLKPSAKFKLMNGALECELREYELFDGKHKEYKSQEERPQRKLQNRPPRKEQFEQNDKDRSFDRPRYKDRGETSTRRDGGYGPKREERFERRDRNDNRGHSRYDEQNEHGARREDRYGSKREERFERGDRNDNRGQSRYDTQNERGARREDRYGSKREERFERREGQRDERSERPRYKDRSEGRPRRSNEHTDRHDDRFRRNDHEQRQREEYKPAADMQTFRGLDAEELRKADPNVKQRKLIKRSTAKKQDTDRSTDYEWPSDRFQQEETAERKTPRRREIQILRSDKDNKENENE